jgi:Dyp-type peroxidase family
MQTLDKQDIQGFIFKGYGKLKASRYYLLSITDSTLAKKWLDVISNDVTDGTHKPTNTGLNIAFTQFGLRALGMYDENMKDFSREFLEGIDTAHRNRLLADIGTNDPKNWEFGANSDNAKDKNLDGSNIHLMLLAFAKDETALHEYCAQLEEVFTAHQLKITLPLDGIILPENKIHLGFKDSISQPAIEGAHDEDATPNNTVATGEFLMGYKNEYGVYPDTPFINKNQGDVSLLPLDAGGSGKRDLGRNGSYLVYKKMEEKVDLFWEFMNETTKNDDGSLNEHESIKLASKMIGRWPNGAPIVKYPDNPPPGLSKDDDFGYSETDKEGLKCPFGSHMRRNNPRDAFEDNGPKLSLKLTNKHRIIRRGRSYGEPLVATPTNYKHTGEIGLHFMCFNADIAGQFEFIQHTWANFPKFESLYNDPDPITGVVSIPGENPVQNFTVPQGPVNKTVPNLPQFVVTKGGAYFFFPSITAIKYFSTI